MMRNAMTLGKDWVVTTDNSGGIGEKVEDFVQVSDRNTAYFAARVALLEQWAAGAEPKIILIHNFSGPKSWTPYVEGVKDLFLEAGVGIPEIGGSTETNFELKQSAMAVTMIGRKKEVHREDDLQWFTYGTPLVGQEVLDHPQKIASVQLIKNGLDFGLISALWPVGSSGISKEFQSLMENDQLTIETPLDSTQSAGPSTVVLLGIPIAKVQEAKQFFGQPLIELASTQL